jgi:uroporphyrin-III C-methyltransferase/precorrin-2 dehydrogenase/sirohydrochlorin ferrochelatase
MLTPEIAAWVASGLCEHRSDPFDEGCLTDAALAIGASGDESLDAALSAAARARSLPVNVVDRPTLSTFIMPAIVERSPVVIAISTGGTSPTLAQWIRERIERLLPRGVGALARLAGAMRPLVQRSLPDPARRRRFWRATLTGSIGGLALAGELKDAEAALLTALHREVDRKALPSA